MIEKQQIINSSVRNLIKYAKNRIQQLFFVVTQKPEIESLTREFLVLNDFSIQLDFFQSSIHADDNLKTDIKKQFWVWIRRGWKFFVVNFHSACTAHLKRLESKQNYIQAV